VDAIRNRPTAFPVDVNRSSGLSTRLPVMVSVVSFMVWFSFGGLSR